MQPQKYTHGIIQILSDKIRADKENNNIKCIFLHQDSWREYVLQHLAMVVCTIQWVRAQYGIFLPRGQFLLIGYAMRPMAEQLAISWKVQ